VEILNPNLLDENKEPEPTERTMSVLNLTESLRVTEAGIKLSVESDCNEERAAAPGQIIYADA
jgi:hypothetical protein